MQEIRPELDKLKLKVCSRARNFLLVKMNNLRKPKTNFQILQESVLLKFKPLLTFLKEHSQETFVELTNYYAEVMQKIYNSLIKTYIKESKKLIEERITKNHQIINEDIKAAATTQQSIKELITNIGSNIKTMTEGAQQTHQTETNKESPYVVDDRLHIIEAIEI